MTEEDGEKAGSIMVYECSEKFVGIHYSEGDLVFQSIGDTREECIEDMMMTLNHMPPSLEEIGNDEAELVDVRPLKLTKEQ